MSRRIIHTDQAPSAVGPYSQGTVAGRFLFTSMQIALDPESGEIVGSTAPEQMRQCLQNIAAIVRAADGQLPHVVKTMVYLTDMAQFAAINKVYAEFFPDEPPPRGVVEVPALPKGALVAVEAIAQIK
ncbi:MAG: Rid family detoxifying hydrolase [Candidatus Eisenbacteria sp.]|nr:Rid family detoxifying hydrolase [Candidatus Eisenbacteria bacterium]